MKGLSMRTILAAIAATVLPVAAAQAAGPMPTAIGASGAAPAGLLQTVGWRDRPVQTSDYCKPYNGPYGYYGNPYCEGGFNRYGKAGGYEIDLTRYFDERYYTDRPYRRR